MPPRAANTPPAAPAPARTEGSGLAVPPVRMPRAVRAPTPVPSELTAAVAASTAVSTPRPADTAIETLTITPMPEDVASGSIPVPHRAGMSQGMMIVAGAVALVLGGICTWAIFGVGAPTSATTAAASIGGTEPTAPTSTSTSTSTSTQASPAGPPVLVPISPGSGPTQPVATPAVVKSPVVIRAHAGARIEIDGADAGPAPLQTDLTVGEHVVRVVMPGYIAWEKTVDVVAGQNPIVEAKLVRSAKKKKGTPDPAAVVDDEPEPPAEELAPKAPPIKPGPSPLLPTKPPPPPPAPDPSRGPFLPTTPG